MMASSREVTSPSGQITADWSRTGLVDWSAIGQRLAELAHVPYVPHVDPITDNARRRASGLPERRGKWAPR